MKKKLLLSFLYFSIHLQAQSNWELLSPKPSFRTGIDIHFVTSDVGYILNQSEILETNNSGLTWTKKQDITNGVDMDFGNSVGYIVGNNGYVLKTINAGQSWSQITTGSAVNFNSVTVVDTDNIILSSAN